MERVARVIVTHPRRILAITGALSVLAAAMLFRISFNADITSFVLEGNETGRAFAALQNKYDVADPINVVLSLPPGGDFLDAARLSEVVVVRDALIGLDGVRAVTAVVPATNPLDGRPITADFLANLPPVALETFAAGNPLVDLLVSPDRRHTLLLVDPGPDGIDVARSLADFEAPTDLELTLSGNPVVFASVLDILSLVLLGIPPIVVLLLLAVFYANIGDRRLSVLAIVPAVLGSLWTFGLVAGLGRQVDLVTVIVPIFVIVMGSADGLHFVTHFQQESERSLDPLERTASALRHVGIPMILTTVSTAAGFLSLLVTDVQPIRQLGVFVAVGISFAGIISFFALPAAISHIELRPRHRTAMLGPRVVDGLQRLVATRRPAVVVALGLVTFAAIGIPRLAVDSDQLFFFKDDHPVRQAFERTEELFGGATPLVGEFVFDPDAAESDLPRLRAISREMEGLSGVRRIFSAADLAVALPPEQTAAVLSGSVAAPIAGLVAPDGLRFVLLPASFTTSDLQGWLQFAEDTPEVRVITGMPVIWDEVARLVLRAQLQSLAVAFALVVVMLFAVYRRVRQTLVALVPIALTVAVLLSFLAISGIQLNLVTAVLASIVIGVGIDYTIHFVAAIDLARRAGPGYVVRAVARAGRPIVANALGIAAGLTALWLSPLAYHRDVSLVMWVAMTVAALSALVLIPALLPREGVAADR